MKANKALKIYCLLGLILCAAAGGIIGIFFAGTSDVSPDDLMPTVLLAGSILLCVLILKDARDQRKTVSSAVQKRKFGELIRSEFRLLSSEIRTPTTRAGLLAYFLWASSQYTILILFADFQIKYTHTVLVMMCGYLIGVAILGVCKRIADEKMIRAGFVLIIASFIAFFVVDFFVADNMAITSISSFFYTMGNAFLSPSMLSLFSKERAIHQQGKGFGLIVSADTSGFLAGSMIVIILNHLSIQLEYVFLLSFCIFIASWLPYAIYEKRRPSKLLLNPHR